MIVMSSVWGLAAMVIMCSAFITDDDDEAVDCGDGVVKQCNTTASRRSTIVAEVQ
jgi:hypothetical protein